MYHFFHSMEIGMYNLYKGMIWSASNSRIWIGFSLCHHYFFQNMSSHKYAIRILWPNPYPLTVSWRWKDHEIMPSWVQGTSCGKQSLGPPSGSCRLRRQLHKPLCCWVYSMELWVSGWSLVYLIEIIKFL